VARVLLVAEHDGHKVNPNLGSCIACAREFEPEGIDAAVFATAGESLADQAAAFANLDRVLLVENPANEGAVAAVIAPQVVELAAGYTHLLGPSGTFGRDLMPRVAALLGVGQLSDIMAVEGPYQFRRPIYAGNAIVTVLAPSDSILVGTVRTASYPTIPSAGGHASVEHARLNATLPQHTRYVERSAGSGDRPDLQTATRVVAGGRGLGSEAHFELINALADTLGAAVGASRAAVDAGFVANELQVGQTGKIIAPELYVAVGISGAIQHLTGIKDAGTIVAINRDADAPIFDSADIGMVADLFEVVPELIELLKSA